ncbi:MAG: M64 family metallopeptidase [Bacteroidota bacterium]
MRSFLFIILIVIPISLVAQSKVDQFFSGESMRLDFVLAGNFSQTEAYLFGLSKELSWTGSLQSKEPYVNGNFYVEMYKPTIDSVIFSKSFNTLFGEWQTTPEAKTKNRAFQQTLYFPAPLSSVILRLFRREDANNSRKLLQISVNPNDFLIPVVSGIPDYTTTWKSGDPEKKVDLVFIAEGYTADEKAKFLKDVHRMSDYFFSVDPFNEHKNKFNIHAVYTPSLASGSDNPGISKWISTAAGTGFYTFGSERYLTSSAYWKICNLITNVPHDHILILVNTDKYGGGGIYNHYSVFTSDHPLSEVVFVHEFGHGFAGLGDEYYNSEVAYEGFYPPDEEPLPPNLTTMVNFDSKWRKMIPEDVPIPTPAIRKYENTVGVFEGGGYVSRGIYRPQMNCRMKSNDAKDFCQVCKKSLEQMIFHYAGK